MFLLRISPTPLPLSLSLTHSLPISLSLSFLPSLFPSLSLTHSLPVLSPASLPIGVEYGTNGMKDSQQRTSSPFSSCSG